MYGIDDMLGRWDTRGKPGALQPRARVDGQLSMISTLFEALEKGRSCLVIIPHTTVDAFLHDIGRSWENPFLQ